MAALQSELGGGQWQPEPEPEPADGEVRAATLQRLRTEKMLAKLEADFLVAPAGEPETTAVAGSEDTMPELMSGSLRICYAKLYVPPNYPNSAEFHRGDPHTWTPRVITICSDSGVAKVGCQGGILTTAGHVRERIHAEFGLPREHIVVLFGGQILLAGDSLLEAGVCTESTLNCIAAEGVTLENMMAKATKQRAGGSLAS